MMVRRVCDGKEGGAEAYWSRRKMSDLVPGSSEMGDWEWRGRSRVSRRGFVRSDRG